MVGLLSVVARQVAASIVRRDGDDGARVMKGASDAGQQIRRAGAGGRQANAGTAGRPRVAIGHMSRGALVMNGDETDFGRVIERVHDAERLPARHAEDKRHTLSFQAVDNGAAACLLDLVRQGRSFL